MSKLRKLTETILPAIAKSGRLGSKVQFVRCVSDDTSSGEAQFASTICFVLAEFQSEEKVFQQPLLVKYILGDADVREWLLLDYQFQNEVVVYEKVLPFLGDHARISELFPQYFYGVAGENDDPNDYVIVLEDMRNSGFQMCPTLLDLDFAHCALAFQKLGAFHALSFAAKEKDSKAFYDITNSLIEARLWPTKSEEWNNIFVGCLDRAAEPLLKKAENHKDVIQDLRNKLKDSYKYLSELFRAEEPMSVICHGDFCRNNVLFKYSNNTPVDIRFFDLATARYGSPMLDFTFFFLLNNSEDSRKLHREQYLQIYYDSLSSSIPGVKIPSLEDFREEFRRKAVYGFMLCSFFKPALMDPEPFKPLEEVHKTEEQKTARVLKNGGEKGTQVISNMLRELIDLNCIM